MNKGFSLLELSIVLVIIGLIAGGIVAGASMVRAAELRAVITEYTQYQTSINTFRDKYLGIPGDLRNANAFWADAADGDGDGDLNSLTSAAGEANTDSETFGFWEQLALAELIAGTFDGQSGALNGVTAEIGHNVPASKLSGAGWSVLNHIPYLVSSTILFEGTYGNNLRFGSESAASTTVGAIISPTEMWNMDKKIDDGKPGRGKIRTREASIDCHTAGTSNTLPLADVAEYDLTSDDTSACTAIFILE